MTDNNIKGGIALKKIIAVCTVLSAAAFLLVWTLLLPKTVKYTVKQQTKEQARSVYDEEKKYNTPFCESESYTVKLIDGKIIAQTDGKTVMEFGVNPEILTSSDVEMLTQGILLESTPELETLAEYLQS